MYEKQVQQAAQHIKPEPIISNNPINHQSMLQQQQQTTPQNSTQTTHQQQAQQTLNDETPRVPSPTKESSTENIDVTTIQANNTTQQVPQPQQVQKANQHVPQQVQQQNDSQPQQHIQQTSQQQAQTQDQNNLNIVLNGDGSTSLKTSPETDANNQTVSYNREIPPPNSIYGIESLTSKSYDAEARQFNETLSSPRFQNYNISSPHHSSPDRDPNRMHRMDNNWVSPVKNHPFRGLCPPTSPYLDNRDANMVQAAAAAAAGNQASRRFMPPFYGTGRNFVHPTNDRSRYSNYPVSSPMMSTLGYPRDTTMDARYSLHIPPALGFEEDKFKLSPPSVEDKHIWTKQEVELLLDLYEEHKSKLQDPRVRKTKVWDDIAKHIHEKLDTDVNGCQCNQKFRNMKADYQKVVEHNARAGSFRKTCKYYDRLEKLLTPVSETDKFKGDENASNGAGYTNGFNSKAGTPNGTGFYENSRNSSSPEEEHKKYENNSNVTSNGTTPSSPEKRSIDQIETAGDDSSPPPTKRPRSDCNCGSINKKELIDVLKDFLREQRKREEDTICKIQTLHKEKLDAVVKFLDLFQELVKKV